jgi:hypothetical protein
MGIPSVQKVSQSVKNLPTPNLNALRFRANIYCTYQPASLSLDPCLTVHQ